MRLEEIEKRANRAAKGPRCVDRVQFDGGDMAYEINDERGLVAFYENNYDQPMNAKFDAELFAAASEDIPWLLAQLRAAIEMAEFYGNPNICEPLFVWSESEQALVATGVKEDEQIESDRGKRAREFLKAVKS